MNDFDGLADDFMVFLAHFVMIFSWLNPSAESSALTLSAWLPWSSMTPFFAVPPQASLFLSFFARSLRSMVFLSSPSIIVASFPNRRLTIFMVICCSACAMVSQTQSSRGRPQVGHTSLIGDVPPC